MQTYEEIGYAYERLVGTIVRYNGKAIKIATIEMNGSVAATELVSNKKILCKLKDLDITPVPLGYMNYNTKVFYLSRCPVRRDWKQGLRVNTMRVAGGYNPAEFPNKQIGLTIEGKYPSLNRAEELLRGGVVNSVAYDRQFAVYRDNSIYYKEIIVGTLLSFKERRYTLMEGKEWVMESLEESFAGVENDYKD